MKILLSVFFLQTVFFVTAQFPTDKMLRGLWNSSWTESIRAPANADAAFYSIYHNSDLYFEGDSLWRLEFPCKRIGVEAYSLADYLFINDSTFIYNGERFSRQNYDSSSIETLKMHELNWECYARKWNLVRTESGGDGTGVVFIFPFKIADSIVLEKGDLDGKVLKLLIEGKERTFNFQMEKEQFEYYLILTPTQSWDKKEQVMWTRYWDLPSPRKKEMKEIKRTEGIKLELRFRSI